MMLTTETDWDYINYLRVHGHGSAEIEFLKQYDAGLVSLETLMWFEQMHHRRNALTLEMWIVGACIVLTFGVGMLTVSILAFT